MGRVPALADGEVEVTIFESGAIVESVLEKSAMAG